MAEEVEISDKAVDLVSPFNRPIPGQSLTNDPDTSYPWESPPEYVTVEDALDYLVEHMFQKEQFISLIQILNDKTLAITNIAQIILEKGWRSGKWKSDLMMLLAEPLMVILMAVSERAGIHDYEIYEGESSELDLEDELQVSKDVESAYNEQMLFRGMPMPPVKKESVPEEVLEKIEDMPIPKVDSLLAPTKEESTESLLGRN
tara:strand:+ start:420 stop:1028 length:609 start_codon:yes stop_codon:yes gene_type:complete